MTFGLILANGIKLAFRRRLSQEVVHAGLSGNSGSGHGIVSRDHDGLDAHLA